jgi:hypothetical protein
MFLYEAYLGALGPTLLSQGSNIRGRAPYSWIHLDLPPARFPLSKYHHLGVVKKWKTGFFYVKNTDPNKDLINLPAFDITPLTDKKN